MSAAGALNDAGAALAIEGRWQEASGPLLRAAALEPGWALPRYNLAQALLAQERYDIGWLLYEARRKVLPMPQLDTPLPFPEWRGESISGRRIVVLGEQGLGDQIMFARFLPALERLGAEVVYASAPEVAPLFACAKHPITTSIKADYWALLCSLPLKLGAACERYPPPLAPKIPAGRGAGIGIAAKGRTTNPNDGRRSLFGPDAERLLALGRDLSPEATGATDFLETARIVADLDLVISVDTAIAHLAASMGKPTWILLPSQMTDWRWLRGREDSPWYPGVRLFRQPVAGDWSEVLDCVDQSLRKTMRTKGSPPFVSLPPEA